MSIVPTTSINVILQCYCQYIPSIKITQRSRIFVLKEADGINIHLKGIMSDFIESYQIFAEII